MTVAVKNDNKTPLIVPSAIRRKAGFKTGQELEFKVSGGVITILPKPPRAPKARHDDDDEYTPEQRRMIDARLAEAEEDIKAGRVYGPFDSAEEMAAHIEARITELRAAKRKAKPSR